MNREDMNGHLMAFLCILLWGISPTITKGLMLTYSPYMIMLIRFVCGYALYWVIARKWLHFDWKYDKWFMLCGVLGFTIYSLCSDISYSIAPASLVSVLLSLSPIFTALIQWLVMKGERPSVHFAVGCVISLIGVAMISFDGVTTLEVSPIGVILPLCAAMSFAVYSIILGKVHQFPIDNLTCVRRIYFYGFLFIIPVLLLVDFPFTLEGVFTYPTILKFLFIGGFCSVCTMLCWNKAIKVLGATTTSIYIYVYPVISVGLAALILHETITLMIFAGIVLTIAGTVISVIKDKK